MIPVDPYGDVTGRFGVILRSWNMFMAGPTFTSLVCPSNSVPWERETLDDSWKPVRPGKVSMIMINPWQIHDKLIPFSCFLWKCLEASVPPIILGIESLVLSVFGTTTSLTVNLTVVIRIARQNMGMNLRRLPNNSKSSHQKRLAYVITCGWFQHVSADYHMNKEH